MLQPTKQAAGCHAGAGAYVGVFDLSGNAAEWENACESPLSAEDPAGTVQCLSRGGDYNGQKVEVRCAAKTLQKRKAYLPSLGFRCCSNGAGD